MVPGMEALLLTLLLSIISVAAISPGSTLYASDTSKTWSSPNNTFSLHFIPVKPPTSPPSFMLGIVHSGGVPVIWTAGHGAAVDDRGSFRFLSSGSLRLVSGSGATVWDSGTSHLGVSSAFLDEQGNLVLSNGTGAVWSSFDHPTDTIMPSQSFTVGMVLRSGLYSFRLVSLGHMILEWNDSVVYWDKGNDPMLYSSLIDATGGGYVEGSDELRIMKLDSDGNLRIYSSSRGSGSAEIRWVAVEDQCEVFGYCGANGICRYKDSVPVCGCPSRDFEMIDPNNSRKGCRRKVKLEDCRGSATMLNLHNVRLLTYPPQSYSQIFFIAISACRQDCLSQDGCFASTSLSDGTGQCYLKAAYFISGYQSPAQPSTSFIKVCPSLASTNSPSLPGKGKGWSKHTRLVIEVVLGTLLALISFQVGLWLWCRRNSPRFGGWYDQYTLLEYASSAPVQFSYKELKELTSAFKEKLGAGRFGSLYRGILGNGTIAAVKKLEGIEQEEKQFRLGVATICNTHHLNLVRMIGFCYEGQHRLLVYEFMKNGSLDKYLFGTENQPGTSLDWQCRFNIALGVGKGITYLHEECCNCIVHCDIKPENILLDENFKAKLADIGLVKLVSPNQTSANVRGTKGYVAPEWLSNLSITSKCDVYSYGMVLLEIVSGRRNFEVPEESYSKEEFSVWAYEEFEKGNIKCIVDKRLPEHEVNLEQVRRVIVASFWCIQEQPEFRPTIGKVLQMLEGITEAEKPPPPKSMNRESLTGNGECLRSDVRDVSTVSGDSAPTCSSPSFSSLQVIGFSPLALERNIKRETSSLLLSKT